MEYSPSSSPTPVPRSLQCPLPHELETVEIHNQSPVRLRLVTESTSYDPVREVTSPVRMQLELLACRARMKEIEESYEQRIAQVKEEAAAQVSRLKKSVAIEMQRQIDTIKREAEEQVLLGLHQLQSQSENQQRILQHLEKRLTLTDAQVTLYAGRKVQRQESTAAIQEAASEITKLRSLVESLTIEKQRLAEDLEASCSSDKTNGRRAADAMSALTRSRRELEQSVEELVTLRSDQAQHHKEKAAWIEQLSQCEQAIMVLRGDMQVLQREVVDEVVGRLEVEIKQARKSSDENERLNLAHSRLEYIKDLIKGAMAEAKGLENSSRSLLHQAREDQAKTQRALTQQVRRMAALEELRLKDCKELAALERRVRETS